MLPVPVDLVCPRCKGPLPKNGSPFHCDTCGAEYESAEDVPILVPEALSEQHEHQRGYFDAEFSEYERYEPESWRISFNERVFGSIGILDGGAPYLDAGVGGSGATVIEAARRGVEAVGCDLSVPGVLVARRFARDEGVDAKARFVVCAAEALPFRDVAFGSASAIALLEHLDDDRASVAELARVLRPGGLVWFTVPHAFRYMLPFVWPVYWWHDRRIGHKRHYDEAELVLLCAEAGLEHVRTSYSAHPVKLVQFAGTKFFPRMRSPDSSAWWRLEELDRRAESRPYGAMHLSAVFRRAS
jgi:SAM-dependent methyltransferase